MIHKYPNSIEEAAKILDKEDSNWSNKLSRPVIMDNGLQCILAQLYGGWATGMRTVFALELLCLDFKDCPYINDEIFGNKASNTAWIKEVQKRRTLTFVEALAAMKEGKTVQIECCKYLIHNGQVMLFSANGEYVFSQSFNSYVLRDNWRIVD